MHACCDRASLAYQRDRGFFRRADFLGLLAASLATTACSSTIGGAGGGIPPSDVLIAQNGHFITLVEGSHGVTAVSIRGGKILDVAATGAELLRKYPKAHVFDLHGAIVAPGFIEAHAHLSQAALDFFSMDLGYPKYKTVPQALAALKAVADKTPGKKWVFADRLDPSLQQPYSPPLIAELDAVSTTHPIFIEDASSHLGYVNSAALAAAGVYGGETFPGGGSIGGTRSAPTGIVYEIPAFAPFLKFAPKPDAAQLVDAINGVLSQAQHAGCTTLHDPACGLITGHLNEDIKIYEAIATTTPVRVITSPILADLPQLPALENPKRAHPGAGVFYGPNDVLWLPSAKLWVDGTPQGRTAAMSEPYLNCSDTACDGTLDYSDKQLHELLHAAKKLGWSLLMHTNGDRAIEQGLDAVEAVFGSPIPAGFRIRFEHCTYMRPDQFARMARLGVTPTFLNNHTYIWGDAFKLRILGDARAQQLDAANEAVKLGMIFSFHCDYGVSPIGPLRYMQTAVTRRTDMGTVLGKQYAITPLDALKAVTIHPAVQLGIDDRVGTIEPGKLADFVELDANPLTVEPSRIAGIGIRATWQAGARYALH